MASTLSLPGSRVLSYALDQAPADSPIVLLSNSLCAPYKAWDHVVRVLNQAGFRTLRYDQPGHGKSSAPKGLDTTFESMADDVQHLLKFLEISRLHSWIGVSMGAAAGIVFTTKYPKVVSKLVICDTISASPINAGVDDVFGPRVAAARETGNLEAVTQGTLERWFGKPWLEKNPEEAQRMRNIMSGTTVDGFETCCHAIRSKTFDLRPLFAKVGASVDDALCVVGEKDASLPQTMEEMRNQIEYGFKAAGKGKKINLVVIKDAGHVCFIDGFDQFSKSVLSWV
ncbi:Fc.00g103660.m01.CDS01 [Cosmosporella sp. VM-42]